MRKYLARRRAIQAVVREIREAAGFSQRELSAVLKEGNTYMWEIEHGQHGVRVEELIAIAEACDRDPLEVLRLILSR